LFSGFESHIAAVREAAVCVGVAPSRYAGCGPSIVLVKMDDMQMFDQTKSKRSATSPSHSCCIATLLSIIAILLSGIFASLCVLTYHVVPLLKASQPIVASIDPVAIKPYFVKAGAAVNGAALFFEEFSIEDLQLVPSSIPDLLLSISKTDLAPLAHNVTSATSSMVTGISGLLFGENQWQVADTFTQIANVMSFTSACSAKFVGWTPLRVPTLPRSPPTAPATGNTTTASDPWHGLPSMIFGKSPIDWLYDQTDPTRVKTLGEVCTKLKMQIGGLGVLNFQYEIYEFDYETGKIRERGVNTPISPESAQTFLNVMDQACTALTDAATSLGGTAASPKKFITSA